MKFIKTTYSQLKKGDYVKFISNKIPSLFIYGYVRVVDGEKIVQSKNAVQLLKDSNFCHIKPNKRFFKTKLNQGGQIFILK